MPLMVLACGITAAAATQNAALDAWVVERLPETLHGWANGAQAGSHALGGLGWRCSTASAAGRP